MSNETIEWLNANTLVGFVTAKNDVWEQGWGRRASDGTFEPWWQRDGFTGAFDGPVPIDEVERRLFFWTPQECQVNVMLPCDDIEIADGLDDDGRPVIYHQVPDRKAIVRPDTEEVFGIFGADSYKVHEYRQWLVEHVATILDASGDDLGISSAGLLRGGAQAWVSMELPQNVRSRSGDVVRPAIVAATSLDGSMSSTYKKSAMRPVCDNSLSYAIAGIEDRVKIKHSSRSLNRIGDIRDALGLFYEQTSAMIEFMDRCAETPITTDQFTKIVEQVQPMPEVKRDGGKVTNQAAITKAENRRNDLYRLWRNDPRVGHLSGTLAGAHQAVNTYNEHYRPTNTNQVERVMTGTLGNTFATIDRDFWAIVDSLDIPIPEVV